MFSEKQIALKDITHYPSSAIYFQKIRNRYIIIPTDFGITIIDECLNILHELRLAEKPLGIQDIYIKPDSSEVILICLVANNFIIKLDITNFTYKIIKVPEEHSDIWLSRIYYWYDDALIIIGAIRFYLKIPFNEDKPSLIKFDELKAIDKNFTRFLKDMIKHCGYHRYFAKHKKNLIYIKFVDYERYKYLYMSQSEEQRYLVDYVNKEKTILAPYDYEDYVFEYENDYFVTTQEYKIEVFYKGKSIFKLPKQDRRVFFGGKLFQDLQNTYLCVLDGCTKTNSDVVLTKYKLPNIDQ